MSVLAPMTWKSYVIASAATVVATVFMSLPPSRLPGGLRPEQPREAASAPAAASDIEQQAARLQARLHAEALYREPSRNPFRFAPRREAPSGVTRAQTSAPAPDAPLPALPPPLPFTLAGIAADDNVRTAIFSTPSGVVLARVGDEVLGYRLASIGEDAAELVNPLDGASLRLSLKTPNPQP
jgi:hypothetical protein